MSGSQKPAQKVKSWGRQFIFVNARFLPVGFNQFPNRSGALKVVFYFINWSIVISTEAGGFLLAIAAGCLS